jgi:acyl dehydratase
MGSSPIRDAYERVKERIGAVDRVALGRVSRLEFQRLAVACGDDNPLYFDDEFSRTAGYESIIAPPLYLSSQMDFGPGAPEETLRSDGTTGKESISLPIEGLRIMGAGQQIEFHRPLYEGTEAVMEVRVEAAEFKEGRSGEFIVVRLLRKYMDSENNPLLTCVENFVVR